MDNDHDQLEVFSELGEREGVCNIEKVDPLTWSPARIKFLYDHVLAQEFNQDDFGKEIPELFVRRLFAVNSEYYTLGNKGLIAFINIMPQLNADIHFTVWDEPPVGEIVRAIDDLSLKLLEKYKLNRITGWIPGNNKQCARLATICGYKFEGSLRGMFLQGGKYYDLHIYGLTKDDAAKRKVRH